METDLSFANRAVCNRELVSEVCVACGLCCSGAIFEGALIKSDEAVFVRSLGMQVNKVPRGEDLFFTLPCPHLCGTACSIYEQQRPTICGEFFCDLAKGLDKGDIGLEEAKARIAQAQDLLRQIQPFLSAGENLAAARDRWSSIGHEALPQNARFHMLMFALLRLFDDHFRSSRKVLPPAFVA